MAAQWPLADAARLTRTALQEEARQRREAQEVIEEVGIRSTHHPNPHSPSMHCQQCTVLATLDEHCGLLAATASRLTHVVRRPRQGYARLARLARLVSVLSALLQHCKCA